MQRIASLIVISVLSALPAAAADWSVSGQMAESCSCNPACPCVFGSPPTRDVCEGSRLIEIKEGRSGDTRLDGLKFVISFSMNRWIKVYVDESASDAQLAFADEFARSMMPWPHESTERAAVQVKREGDRVRFSVPDSAVEIELMRGQNGEAIKVDNIDIAGYTQYKAISNVHKSARHSFKWEGTNGFTGRLKASGGN